MPILFALMPIFFKEIMAIALMVRGGVITFSKVQIILFLGIFGILAIKSIADGSFAGFYLAAKISFLFVGANVGALWVRRNAAKGYAWYGKSRNINLFLLIALFASIISLLFGSPWNLSEAYSTRSTSLFRGFGELGIFLCIMMIYRGNIVLIFLIGLLSSSKALLLALTLSALFRFKLKALILLPGIVSLAILAMPLISNVVGNDYIRQFEVSVLDPTGAKSVSNRVTQTQEFLKDLNANPSILVVGSFEQDLFLVWPEFTAAYLVKIGGLPLFFLTYILLFTFIGFSLGKVPIYLLIAMDTHGLSSLACIMYGFLSKLPDWKSNKGI